MCEKCSKSYEYKGLPVLDPNEEAEDILYRARSLHRLSTLHVASWNDQKTTTELFNIKQHVAKNLIKESSENSLNELGWFINDSEKYLKALQLRVMKADSLSITKKVRKRHYITKYKKQDLAVLRAMQD